eukprot:TRINITY_DN94226_c0_g1_i1.p1 TRINITY_DN94226_c0_g1~~TRINITY_DN94226_c0_g1_i1.p1  ORF type:complete len:436 (-),score=49.45 TRINITY_DN94226_c0_g1_i1:17-1324(-)
MGGDSQDSESTALVSNNAGKVSDAGTVVTFLKMIMGAGGFAFPWAFAKMGLAGGAIAVFGVAALGYITMAELLAIKRRVETERGRGDASYSDVAQATLGTWGSCVVVVMTVTSSLGAMAAYLSYVSTTLVLMYPVLHRSWVIAITGFGMLPLVWLRDFSILAKVAGFGTLAVVLGYVATIAYAMLNMSPREHLQWFTPMSSAARGFGPIAFLLCIHCISFPLMTASRASAVEGRFERLFGLSVGSAALINSLFGALGYVYFGPDVSSIVLNDMHGPCWICMTATKILVCIDLLCTYPIMFSAASHILEIFLVPCDEGVHETTTYSETPDTEKAEGRIVDGTQSADFCRQAIRVTLLIVSMIGGYKGSFGGLVSLVGDISLTSLAYVLPPIMTMTLFKGDLTPSRVAVNCVTCVLGAVVGTLSAAFTMARLLGYHV